MSGISGGGSGGSGGSDDRLPEVLELYRRRQLRWRSEAARDSDGRREDEVIVSVDKSVDKSVDRSVVSAASVLLAVAKASVNNRPSLSGTFDC